MSEKEYVIKENTIKVKNYEDEYTVLNFEGWENETVRHYKALLAQRLDMRYAEAYLNQMFFGKDSTLIDGALINSAIQLLVRCFSNPKGNGRENLDTTKVFRTYSKSIGEKDFTEQFSQFYNARNKLISHDQEGYLENIIGLVVSRSTGIAEDVAEISVRTRYLYKQNQQLLLKMVNVVLRYLNDQINAVKEKLLSKYNQLDFKPRLNTIVCEHDVVMNEW